MTYTLLIVKNAGQEGNWSHFVSLDGVQFLQFELSDFFINMDNGDIQIKELNGAKRLSYYDNGNLVPITFAEVTIRDDMAATPVYSPTSLIDMVNYLIARKYPAYYKFGSGVQSVTGSAVDNTDPANPIINLTGGGGSLAVLSFTGVVGTEQDFTIPASKTAILAYVNRTKLYQTEISQVTTTVTLTFEFFGDEIVEIFYQ